MTKQQRIVVYVILAIMVLMLVFPPVEYKWRGIYRRTHAFIFKSTVRPHPDVPKPIRIDQLRLAMQLAMVSLTGAGVFMAVRGKDIPHA